MDFSELEAQVKDVFINASPRLVLRQAKRIVRQLNNILDGKLDTKTAVTEIVNETDHTITISGNNTIADDGTNSWFADEPSGSLTDTYYVYLYGSSLDPNSNGLYTISEFTDSDTIQISGSSLVDGAAVTYSIAVFKMATGFTMFYDSTYGLFKLGLPDNLNKLSMNGVIVNEIIYDERDMNYVIRNTDEECFAIDERGSLAIPGETFLSDVDTLVKGYFGITVPTSSGTSATIDIPAQWEEGFLAGVLSNIALLENFKNADVYKTQTDIYSRTIAAIIKQEGNRFSSEEHNRNYNYQNPSSE